MPRRASQYFTVTGNLLLHQQLTLVQLILHASFIYTLEEPRSERSMYFERAIDDDSRNCVFVHQVRSKKHPFVYKR